MIVLAADETQFIFPFCFELPPMPSQSGATARVREQHDRDARGRVQAGELIVTAARVERNKNMHTKRIHGVDGNLLQHGARPAFFIF